MSTTAPVKIVCPECRRENEQERIYCHDCGARLDQSKLAPRQASSAETPEQMHKRVSQMFDPRRGRAIRITTKWVKLLAGAALAAVLVLILLPPSLPPAKKSETLPPQISLDLEGMTAYGKPAVLRYSEEDVNAYLANVLKKKDSLNHPLLDFDRAVMQFHPGYCDFTVGRSIFGYTVYSGGTFAEHLQDGRLNASGSRGAIGRLPIHPVLMRYAGFLFGDVVSALERERKFIGRAGGLELRDKEIVLTK